MKSSPPVEHTEELPLADHVKETQEVAEEKLTAAASNLTAAKASYKKQYVGSDSNQEFPCRRLRNESHTYFWPGFVLPWPTQSADRR